VKKPVPVFYAAWFYIASNTGALFDNYNGIPILIIPYMNLTHYKVVLRAGTSLSVVFTAKNCNRNFFFLRRWQRVVVI
jgi:hypothetical protein